MNLETFVLQSEGNWRCMRSGHSLAFRQFEEVLSSITIKQLSLDDPKVTDLIATADEPKGKPCSPFFMEWSAESDWEPDDPSLVSQGSCVLVPFPTNAEEGLLLRSVGYAEPEQAIGKYCFLSDGTFTLTTRYGQSIAEERIWFVSEHVRCRSSVLRTSAGSGVLQTSFSSEVRRLSL
ncbi:phycobiliprotein lyase [Synechococcus sp. CCY9202]|jgi:phycoerythrin-associated linker protein|uniref:phycobiliprotein lyase n=1 Tax=Synechococcus sp. CCY9202 TaxID=174698 RepID=UPI002B1F868D|nr:phycobiliprotein lyase [Synechococcus sp. CCY9202]MEA5422398.1 phycobiliprotein lyase [Synechococcus sp. CCY9202]